MRPTIHTKIKEREALQAEVEQFLASGHRIREVPGYVHTTLPNQWNPKAKRPQKKQVKQNES